MEYKRQTTIIRFRPKFVIYIQACQIITCKFIGDIIITRSSTTNFFSSCLVRAAQLSNKVYNVNIEIIQKGMHHRKILCQVMELAQ